MISLEGKGYRQKYGINKLSFCFVNLELDVDLLVKKQVEKNRRGCRKKKKGVVKTGFIDNKNSPYKTTDQKDLRPLSRVNTPLVRQLGDGTSSRG